MITKEELFNYINDNRYIPVSATSLAKIFNYNSSDDFKQFAKVITQLEQLEEILIINNIIYSAFKPPFIVATITSKKLMKSFAVDKSGSSYMIPNNLLNGAIYLDEVILEEYHNDFKVTKILKRKLKRTVGEVISVRDRIVKSDDQNITEKIKLDSLEDNVTLGTKVEVIVIKIERNVIYGKTGVIIGNKNAPGVDIISKVVESNAPYIFDAKVLAAAKKIPEVIDASDIKNRVDLRNELIVTIDGEDAKDLDDAISLKMNGGNYLLTISIADVSYYVQKNSPIDIEAYERGTSIYLANKVIPMLPEVLSNGICSLHGGVDRYTISVQMELSSHGNLISYQIFPSIINSKARLTYKEVNNLFNGGKLDANINGLPEMLHQALILSYRLRELRKKRGSIDLVSNEAKIIVDENEKVIDIIKREQGEAEKLIEDFMILANETVAEHVFNLDLPFIYRIHNSPDLEKLNHLSNVLNNFRYSLRLEKNKKITPFQYQKALEYFKGKPEETILNTLMLRSFAKARYNGLNQGHFGLASKCYTHFTSPIRRYPDLLVHRLLRQYLFDNNFDVNKWNEQVIYIANTAEHSSDTERRAIQLERTIESMKKAEYLSQYINERFDGIVSGVTNFGIFVELPNTIQGLMRYQDLNDDFYQYDENKMMAIGTYTKKVFKIGLKVTIQVARSDKATGEIDFIYIK